MTTSRERLPDMSCSWRAREESEALRGQRGGMTNRIFVSWRQDDPHVRCAPALTARARKIHPENKDINIQQHVRSNAISVSFAQTNERTHGSDFIDEVSSSSSHFAQLHVADRKMWPIRNAFHIFRWLTSTSSISAGANWCSNTIATHSNSRHCTDEHLRLFDQR